MPDTGNRFGAANIVYTLLNTLGHTVTNVAIPCFYLFSGFLFFYKSQDFTPHIYVHKLKKRVQTLLVPYLVWNGMAFGFELLLSLKQGHLHHFWSQINEHGGFISIFWDYSVIQNQSTQQNYYGPILIPLWFIRDLMLTVLLSPLIYILIKKAKRPALLILGALYYFEPNLDTGFYNLNQLTTAVFYFTWGASYSISGQNMIVQFRRAQKLVILPCFISLGFCIYFYPTHIFNYISPIYAIMGIVTIISFTSMLIQQDRLKENALLSQTSFFMYLAHVPIIIALTRFVTPEIIPLEAYSFLLSKYVITLVATVLICIACYHLMRKISPGLTTMITGGR